VGALTEGGKRGELVVGPVSLKPGVRQRGKDHPVAVLRLKEKRGLLAVFIGRKGGEKENPRKKKNPTGVRGGKKKTGKALSALCWERKKQHAYALRTFC